MTPIIEVIDVTRSYQLGGRGTVVRALRGVSFAVEPGGFVAIVGPSGSGKSTLLNLLGALDRPTSGTVRIDGMDIATLSDARLARLRNTTIGFVFQQFHLLARTSATDNVALPLVYAGVGRSERTARARAALEAVGLGHRLVHQPSELSGGEQQRVAIARALVADPRVILADEPTGNVDTATGDEIMDLLEWLNAERGVALVVITHDLEVAARAPRHVRLRDGVVDEADARRPAPPVPDTGRVGPAVELGRGDAPIAGRGGSSVLRTAHPPTLQASVDGPRVGPLTRPPSKALHEDHPPPGDNHPPPGDNRPSQDDEHPPLEEP
jgi:putative ABC transport system ATP-binding protein